MTIKIRSLLTNSLYGILIVALITLGPLSPFISHAEEVAGIDCSNEDAVAALEEFYHSNDIIFFNPCDQSTCSEGEAPLSSSSIEIEDTQNIRDIFKYLTTTLISTNGNQPMNAVQAAGVMGNFYAESGFNPSAIEVTDRAQKGHGLAQWTFGRWNGPSGLQSFADARNKPWDDLTTQLDYLKWELENTETAVIKDGPFSTTNDPAEAAYRWRLVFERPNPDLAHDDRREGAAVTVYNMYADGSLTHCGTANTLISTNIVSKAIEYALTTPAQDGVQNKESDVRDTYLVDKEKYNPSVDWTDCGGLVATILYATGIDTSFPNVSVASQLEYIRSHTDKFSVTANPTTQTLKPGDLLYVDGHVTIYTGADTYPMVDASLGERVPSVRSIASLEWMLSQDSLVSVRVMK